MSNLIFKNLNDKLILIKTNSKYPDGTNIEIYLKNDNNTFVLSDLGFTTLWLLNLGFKITDSAKFNLLLENNKIIENFYFSDGELTIKIDHNVDCINQQIKKLIDLCNNFISLFLKDD